MRRKNKKKIPKDQAQKIHARRRFKERFGINFTPSKERKFIDAIHTHKANFVKKESNRVTIWDVLYKKDVYRVVYDNNTKNIVTVLPKEPM